MMSYFLPCTTQDGSAKHMHYILLNMVHSLFFQAQLPLQLWVEVLYIGTYINNTLFQLQCYYIAFYTRFFVIVSPLILILVSLVACHPNLSYLHHNKLSSHSNPCIFLSFPLTIQRNSLF